MNVVFTIAVAAVIAVWILAVVRRLDRMRGEIKIVWQRLEGDQGNAAVKAVYNKHVAAYNEALDGFPASILAPIFGFKPARRFD